MAIITAKDWQYDRWPNFTPDEFKCSHTGRMFMDDRHLDRLQELRNRLRRPLIVNSGYRHETHPVEAVKKSPGVHNLGLATDISCSGEFAFDLAREAFIIGFTGIGFQQKTSVLHRNRFIHLDSWTEPPRPNLWTY